MWQWLSFFRSFLLFFGLMPKKITELDESSHILGLKVVECAFSIKIRLCERVRYWKMFQYASR